MLFGDQNPIDCWIPQSNQRQELTWDVLEHPLNNIHIQYLVLIYKLSKMSTADSFFYADRSLAIFNWDWLSVSQFIKTILEGYI